MGTSSEPYPLPMTARSFLTSRNHRRRKGLALCKSETLPSQRAVAGGIDVNDGLNTSDESLASKLSIPAPHSNDCSWPACSNGHLLLGLKYAGYDLLSR